MDKMLPPQSRRKLIAWPRPRTILLVTLATVTTYYLLFSGPSPQLHAVPYLHGKTGSSNHVYSPDEKPLGSGRLNDFDEDDAEMNEFWDIDVEDLRSWRDPDDPEDYSHVEPGYERDGKQRDHDQIGALQHEKDLRKLWRYVYKITANLPSANLIYGNTIKDLDYKEQRSPELNEKLRDDPAANVAYSDDKPVRYNPYPNYNDPDWEKAGYAPYVPCKGPSGELVEDLMVFKGRPHDWPEPKMGSYSEFDMDPNLCWERDTRLGPYGLLEQKKKVDGGFEPIDWDNVNWGDLQRRCLNKNAKRFDLNKSRNNPYLAVYPETAKDIKQAAEEQQGVKFVASSEPASRPQIKGRTPPKVDANHANRSATTGFVPEKRTAVLLRSYTGMEYTENDRQTIRALVSELSLKSGGEYEVFILLHVRDRSLKIFDESETYQAVLQENIPPEFHGMTVLWNDDVVWDIYTELNDENERSVHTAQWLSVQKFSHDHPDFDYFWNWEMDFRYTGHHYDLLDSLSKFARRQPRRGLWERNEQWYVPEYHGDFDTSYRKDVEQRWGNNTVWGPVSRPFVNPVGPKPPVSTPWDDDYEWGIGEDADVITVSPIFNPVHSNWIITNHLWGFTDEDHHTWDLPRRTTIVTQSRVSKRLLDIMHVENKRGNHIASEMTPQSISLLHGFKAVFAPHPVFVDRDWSGEFLDTWFNPGEKGSCSGYGSPMGWGRERRYQGNTWYYRAEPPNRLYNNWMGWTDTGIGGKRWESRNGRPCLPSIMLHPVKNTEPTKRNHKTGFELTYG